jgi:hypothetical protein
MVAERGSTDQDGDDETTRREDAVDVIARAVARIEEKLDTVLRHRCMTED